MNIRPIVFVAMLIGLSSTSAPAFDLNKLQQGLGGMMKQLEQKKDTQPAPPQAVPNSKRQHGANQSDANNVPMFAKMDGSALRTPVQ